MHERTKLGPQFAEMYYDRGRAWSDKGNYDKVIADFNEAIRLEPKNALPYNDRGLAWLRQKEFDKALADFSEAIRLENPHIENKADVRRRLELYRDKKPYRQE